MPRALFDEWYQELDGNGIFVRRNDDLQRKGVHPPQRMVAALCMLAYGTAADSLDEYVLMSKDSVLQSLKSFCSTVIRRFGKEYLRVSNEVDVKRILVINAASGFPGCIGSIDCQH